MATILVKYYKALTTS